jgi:hypothetical protein
VTSALRGRAISFGAAALLVVASACEPAPSPAASPGASSAVPTATAATVASPALTVDPATIELHFLDARFVPGDRPSSADGQVLWAAGRDSLPELWRFVPGGGEPERIYLSPHPDAAIQAIAASSAGYAFIEESRTAYGDGGWRLWLLAGPGQDPIEVDRGTAPGAGVAPTIAMDDEWIAWASFDEPRGGPRSRLRVAPLTHPEAVVTRIDAPIDERLLWNPVLDAQELWYATVKVDPDALLDDEFHIEHLDLGNPSGAPTRFAGSGNDFNPAVSDAFVVWKTNRPGDAPLNWGTLRVLDRRSGDVRTIPMENLNRPSIGHRFVAFDEISHARLTVYDLATNRVLVLASADPGAGGYGGESLSGNLLAFFRQDGAEPPRIGWATLPG